MNRHPFSVDEAQLIVYAEDISLVRFRATVEALERAERERDEWQEWHHVAVRERDRLAVDALAALAGAGIATPEKGYVAEPWALAGDIARLAKERDEARAALTTAFARKVEACAQHTFSDAVEEVEAVRATPLVTEGDE